jgi:hypothetical protein
VSAIAVAAARSCRRFSCERGVTALEILIILVVVCSAFGVGIPVLHRGADKSVLNSNLQTLGETVQAHVIEGYSPEYRAPGEGDPGTFLSLALEQNLTDPDASPYVNPFVGKEKGTFVMNSHRFSPGPDSVAPAVFITDSTDCQYFTFPDVPLGLRRLLAGSLIVAFNNPGGTIDVYFVDQGGQGSVKVVAVPTGQVKRSKRG